MAGKSLPEVEPSDMLEAGLVSKFEVLGLLSLKHRQQQILSEKRKLLERCGPNTENEEEDKFLWEKYVYEEDPEKSRDWSHLAMLIDRYYSAIIQYRQVLNLPAFEIEEENEIKEIEEEKANPRNQFRYLSWTPFSKKLDFTSSNVLEKEFRLFRNKAGTGEYVSLNVCTCYNVCPKWYTRFFSIGSWTLHNAPKNMAVISAMVILSLLPAGTIFGLYAIPSTWGRLALIAGESGILVAIFSMLKVLEDEIVLAYMIGLAAVQVVFVGSVIGPA